MATSGPIYIPHLRRWVTWEYDTSDWPFVALTDDETPEMQIQRQEALGYVIRYGQYWLQVPRPDEKCYAEYHRRAQDDYLRDMAQLGWWDLERDKSGSVVVTAKPIVFGVEDFPKAPRATMANVMHRAGQFESVSEARRNGWNKPILPGTYLIGKEKKRIQIVSTAPDMPSRTPMLEIMVRFDTGEPIRFSINDPEDPDGVADWAIGCQRWTGQGWEIYWTEFPQTPYAEAVASCPTRAYRVRHEPSGLVRNRRVEVIMPLVSRGSRAGDLGALAMQIERSYASMDGRPVRKFLGLSILDQD